MNRHTAPLAAFPGAEKRHIPQATAATGAAVAPNVVLVVREREAAGRYHVVLYWLSSTNGPFWCSGLSDRVATETLQRLRAAGVTVHATARTRRELGETEC